MVTPENNVGLLGKGGRGLGEQVEQADLENCAYFWKNPGYAPENPARLSFPFRTEERLGLSDRNSILMTKNLSGILSTVLIGRQTEF